MKRRIARSRERTSDIFRVPPVGYEVETINIFYLSPLIPSKKKLNIVSFLQMVFFPRSLPHLQLSFRIFLFIIFCAIICKPLLHLAIKTVVQQSPSLISRTISSPAIPLATPLVLPLLRLLHYPSHRHCRRLGNTLKNYYPTFEAEATQRERRAASFRWAPSHSQSHKRFECVLGEKSILNRATRGKKKNIFLGKSFFFRSSMNDGAVQERGLHFEYSKRKAFRLMITMMMAVCCVRAVQKYFYIARSPMC